MDVMPNADAAWLHMDQPTNLMIITSVLWFESPVDWARVKETCRERLVGAYPRFRQRVSESRLPLRGPRFEDDPNFDLDHHFHHVALPAPGDRAALQELVADLMATQLDHAKPLWDMYLVDGYGEGCAIVSRMHHCIADGIALARVLLSLTDDELEPVLVPRPNGSGRSLLRPLAAVASLGSRVGREGVRVISHPDELLRLSAVARDDATALVKLFTTADDAPSLLKGELGVAQRAAWTAPIPLARIKAIGHETGTTVNDVMVAAVAGALNRYLRSRGDPVDEIRAFVPFNLRPLTKPVPRELGNKFGLVSLPLPVGVTGARERLRAVARHMAEIKRSADGPIAYGVLEVVGLTPLDLEQVVVNRLSAKASLVLTNVPGPQHPVYLAGTPVAGVLVWAPRSGSVSTSVTIFSYDGQVTVGLAADAGLVPDPEEILAGVPAELTALRRAARRYARR